MHTFTLEPVTGAKKEKELRLFGGSLEVPTFLNTLKCKIAHNLPLL